MEIRVGGLEFFWVCSAGDVVSCVSESYILASPN